MQRLSLVLFTLLLAFTSTVAVQNTNTASNKGATNSNVTVTTVKTAGSSGFVP